jgi:hypothetical protein
VPLTTRRAATGSSRSALKVAGEAATKLNRRISAGYAHDCWDEYRAFLKEADLPAPDQS